jgi:hypothetical protein
VARAKRSRTAGVKPSPSPGLADGTTTHHRVVKRKIPFYIGGLTNATRSN